MFDMGFQAESRLTREEATRLYLANQAIMPVTEIARRAGVTRQTLHNWAQSALKRNEKTPAPDTSKGPQTTLEEVTPRAQMLSESTSSAKPSDRGEPDGGANV